MSERTPTNSTNVRFYLAKPAAPALLALGLWAAFVGLMQWTGALATLGSDVPWLTAFACGVAALAYAFDLELRRALHGSRGIALAVGTMAAIASCWSPAAMLAFAPAVVACGASLASPCRRRVSSTAAASPDARRGAL